MVSLISLIGVLSLSIGKQKLQSFLILFVAFASGSLLSAAFLHMLPEAYHEIGTEASVMVFLGIILFFFVEKFIHWHHCGKEKCDIHPVGYLNVLGDGLHNFLDGIIIAAAYLTSIPVGLVTTVAIALHEIPQEFGDFSILLHSGMTTRKALIYNLISASTAIIGAILGFMFLSRIENLIPQAIAIAAGGFIYIATADLMPELHKERDRKKLLTQSLALVAGILLLAAVLQMTPHEHFERIGHKELEGEEHHEQEEEHQEPSNVAGVIQVVGEEE